MNDNTKQQMEFLNQQLKELVGIYRSAINPYVSGNEFWIWYTLIILKGDFSQQDICRTWSMSKQTVNTIITNMTAKGFAVLEVVPGTRNRKIIRLTESGKEYGKRIVTPIAEGEQRAFEKLDKKDREDFSNILSKFINALRDEIS